MFRTKLISNFSKFIKKMADNVSKQTQRAERVQYNVLNQHYSIEHEAKLKQKVSIESSIQSLQKQMGRQIAQALKRSESKVAYLIQKALQKYSLHQKQPFKQNQIKQYNKLVKSCQTARWEYIVHRHSCGFTIKNYQIVTQMFKLPPLIIQNNNDVKN